MSEWNGIWVWADVMPNGDITESSQELFTPALALSGQCRQDISAVVLENTDLSESLVTHLAQLGATRILHLKAKNRSESRIATLSHAINQYKPALLLASTNANSSHDLPRVAIRTNAGFISNVQTLESNDTKEIIAMRASYSEALLSRIQLLNNASQMVLLKKRAYSKPPLLGNPGSIPVETLDGSEVTPDRLTLLEQTAHSSSQSVSLEEAAVVVSGGRGLKGPENFHWVEELAEALGGAVGASRAVVDAGWRPHAEQVGQTGKTVHPAVYIALGISGAVQHAVGMNASRLIIAINRDENAPIFTIADIGIVGDALEIAPELLRVIKENNLRFS